MNISTRLFLARFFLELLATKGSDEPLATILMSLPACRLSARKDASSSYPNVE